MTVYLIRNSYELCATAMPSVFTLGRHRLSYAGRRKKSTQTCGLSAKRGQRGRCALNAVIPGVFGNAATEEIDCAQSNRDRLRDLYPVLQAACAAAGK